jgi:hypothetical protein
MVYVAKEITLRGEKGAARTVLDAEQQGRVIWCTVPTTIRELTIRGGRAPMGGAGGGIRMTGGGLVSNCVITSNETTFITSAGGIAIANGTVQDCQILGNEAGWDGKGGGAVLERSRMVRCLVRDNRSFGDPGGLGGGVSSSQSTIIDCRFENNEAFGPFGSAGGAIISGNDTIQRCVFVGNRARSQIGDASRGGAIYAAAPTLVTECLFIGNEATRTPNTGGSVSADYVTARIERCTFLRNSSGIHNGTVSHCIVAWCTRGPPCSGVVTVSCSDLYGNYGGDDVCQGDGGLGNFSADPQFCAVTPDSSENVLLQEDSPCARASCGLVGARGVGCGSVGVRPQPWAAMKDRYRR